jgi:hypothetical protein
MGACARSGRPAFPRPASANVPFAAIAIPLAFLPIVIKPMAVLGMLEVGYWLAWACASPCTVSTT